MRLLPAIILLGMSLPLLPACGRDAPPAAAMVSPSAALNAHGQEFRKAIIEVTPGVHVAIGYGLANSILVEGADGFIVVDAMETLEEGAVVNAEFRRIVGDKPLKAIVYTHNHADHVFGAAAFIMPGEQPEIFAHETTSALMDAVITEFRPVLSRRAMRMFGVYLTGDALGNAGIGPHLGLTEGSTLSMLRPTRTFREWLETEVAGVRLRLVHAPGETDDQLFVWLPDQKVLMPGDNLYRTFPNLYTIRGTTYRNPRVWADSLEKMRDLKPEFLVPSHTRPLSGAETIQTVLTDYRDAIRFVYDQTVRGMNAGLTPDELVERVKLPAHLAESPFLQEFYGKVSWSVRNVFTGSLGWFDGNPSTLQPLPPADQARRMAELAGGEEKLAQAVLDASARGDHQWVLQLSDHVLRLRSDAAVQAARKKALLALGEAESNPNARHYYLTAALEMDGLDIPDQIARAQPDMLRQMPLAAFFTALSVNLDAAAAFDLNRKAVFEFTDSGEVWTVWVRRGVAEVQPRALDGAEIRAQVDSLVFKEMLAQLRNPALTLARDFKVTEGSTVGLARFMALFRPETAQTR
jgi:alkyl sulfatase BDS1-like metallo-beta-lactamase superfamily hydrolase